MKALLEHNVLILICALTAAVILSVLDKVSAGVIENILTLTIGSLLGTAATSHGVRTEHNQDLPGDKKP